MKASLFRQDVVLQQPVRASAQVHDERARLYLRLEHEDVVGFGEVSPQPVALNGDPGLDEVLAALPVILERLGDVVRREGELPSWSRVARLGAATPSANVAAALVEMAVLDHELRATSTSIDDLWVANYATPLQATVSLLDDAEWVVGEGVTRVRVKSAPGALERSTLARLASLDVPVLVDYNAAATTDDEVLEQVRAISEVASISAVEQPYDVGNLVDHARLASRLGVPLSLDESVRSLRDLTHILNYEAATVVCIKPARVGGLANARTMFERARALGLRAYLGGFFESPYARRVHRALANLCVDEPSDVGDVVVRAHGGEETQASTSSFALEPSSSMLKNAERLSGPFLDGP